jgi:FeS assembly SUF system regulator
MIKISQLADYAVIVLSVLAENPNEALSTTCLAEKTHLSAQTIGKIAKILHKAGFLLSTRGHQGGYRLAKAPELITLVEVIAALDGYPAITKCTQLEKNCEIQNYCKVKHNWRLLNQVIVDFLSRLTLADMLTQLKREQLTL